MENVDNKSSNEIGLLIDEKEKELSEALKNFHAVEQEKILLQKKKLELQIRIKDLELSVDKASHNIQQIKIELSYYRNAFWKTKDEKR